MRKDDLEEEASESESNDEVDQLARAQRVIARSTTAARAPKGPPTVEALDDELEDEDEDTESERPGRGVDGARPR